jgi:hypothetical protein
MENLLTNLPVDYLQHLADLHKFAKKNSSIEEFKVNGKNVYEDDSPELYSDEMFKTHSGINIEVSNYGRLRCKSGIIKQDVKKEGYPYIIFPYRLSDLENEISSKKEYKYRTPVAVELIDQDTNVSEIKGENYDYHPYLGISLNKRGLAFSEEYETHRKMFFVTSETRNNDKIVSIPIYAYRLVAETWIENPDPKKYNQVHHIINNGYNNTIFNLMWVTYEQHKIIFYLYPL